MGAEAAVIKKIEHRYRIALPGDFRNYLAHAAPQAFFCDQEWVQWWTPSEIKNIPDEYSSPIKNPAVAERAQTYLFFADFGIWCFAWAICCDEGPNRGNVASIGDADDTFVASSFTAFVADYLNGLVLAHLKTQH